MNRTYRRLALALLALAATAGSGCAPLVVGGAVAGAAVVAADRRSPGIQLEDKAIELRLRGELDARLPRERASIGITSFGQYVLLTGEVTTEADKAEAQAIAARSQNVLGVRNELHVGSLSTLANRNYDTALTSKVLALMVKDPKVPTGAIKVVTSRSVVYLMGRVSRAEGEAAARAASRAAGVRQVVTYFDYISEEEAARLSKPPAEQPPQ